MAGEGARLFTTWVAGSRTAHLPRRSILPVRDVDSADQRVWENWIFGAAADTVVTPAVIGLTVTHNTSTVLAAVAVTPSTVAATVTLPTPAVLAAATVTAAVIPVTVTLPTPTAAVSTWTNLLIVELDDAIDPGVDTSHFIRVRARRR